MTPLPSCWVAESLPGVIASRASWVLDLDSVGCTADATLPVSIDQRGVLYTAQGSLVKRLLRLVAEGLLRIGLESLAAARSTGVVRQMRGFGVVGEVVAGLLLAGDDGRGVVRGVLQLGAEALLTVRSELVLDYGSVGRSTVVQMRDITHAFRCWTLGGLRRSC